MSKTIYANDLGQIILLPSDVEGLVGGSGNDILCGNLLDNSIAGEAGNDQLWGGGSGNDTLAGGAGNDIYWWGRGDGHDLIVNAAENGQDGLFLYNMTASDCQALKQNDSLVFQVDGNNAVNLENWYNAAASNRVQSFIFDNKTAYIWNNGAGATINLHDDGYESDQIHNVIALDAGACILCGGSGNDSLVGAAGDDQLWGGPGGNDTLMGAAGANIFWFGTGDGHDVITSGTTNQDMVKFYDCNAAAISRVNNDLVLTTAQNSTVTLNGWYTDTTKVNKFLFADGSIKQITDSGWQTVSHSGFNIEVDYSRYDTDGFFTNHPERQAVVEEACQVWENIFKDDFADISAGTTIQVINPNTGLTESVVLSTPIDDLRIYLGSYYEDSSTLGHTRLAATSQTGNPQLDARYNSYDNIEPWVGGISINDKYAQSLYFDPTPNNTSDDTVPADKYDFLHILVHEIGHVLGMGPQNAGSQYVTSSNGVNYFGGPNVTAVYGGAAPLDFASGTHFAADATMNAVMKPSLNYGTRVLPTALDKAFFADIGYVLK